MKRQTKAQQKKVLTETLYEISRGLNTAGDEDELLRILARPGLEAGAIRVTLLYIDLDEAGEPEWAETVAIWQREDAPPSPAVTRYYLPEFPFSRLWIASQDEPQLIADVATDERMDEGSRNLVIQGGSHALAIIPLAQAGRWVGLIAFDWGEPHEFGEQEVEIYRALIGLASPSVENRRLVENLEQIVAKRTQELQTFRTLAENAHDGIWILDLEGRMLYANPAEAAIYGYDRPEEMIGLGFPDLAAAEEMERIQAAVPIALSEGWRGELFLKRKDGGHFPAELAAFAITGEEGQPIALAGVTRDVMERKQVEEALQKAYQEMEKRVEERTAELQREVAERERLQQEIIETQQQALRELSTPIVPVLEGVLVLPLVGSIDTKRAQQVMETLLEAIGRYQAEVVIIDITGVPMVDTGVANHLLQVTRAAALLGSKCILVGISPEVAQTIVSLGVDLSSVDTQANLQSGIELALKKTGWRIIKG